MNDLRGQVAEIQASCDGLEKERDFYFGSGSQCLISLMEESMTDGMSDVELRNIELIVQQRTAIEGIEVGERDTLAKLQEILYSTVVSRFLPTTSTKLVMADECYSSTFQEGFEVSDPCLEAHRLGQGLITLRYRIMVTTSRERTASTNTRLNKQMMRKRLSDLICIDRG